MSTRFFYRYRHTFSYGVDPWHYRDALGLEDSEVFLAEQAEELAQQYNWSDKFRGTEVELVERPPTEWLHAEADKSEDQIEYHTERQKELLALAETAEDDS